MRWVTIIHNFYVYFLFHGSLAYFHIPSYLEIESPEKSAASFGYSMGYQSNTNTLVVGDPLNGKGKIYTCPIHGALSEKIICNDVGMDINKYAGNYNSSNFSEQKFCLGATVAVTPSYFLTCAPLWTSLSQKYFGVFGTCLLSNGTNITRYKGLTEQYLNEEDVNIREIFGGIGWTTLADSENKVILIAKPALESSISYIDMDNPTSPAKVLRGEMSIWLSTYTYIGQGFAVGRFFGDKIVYAVSMISAIKLTGAVGFLCYDTSVKKLNVCPNSVLLKDRAVNSMFGVVLSAATFNGDRFSELLVGAPTQNNTLTGYEQGAVHIYIGGWYGPASKTKSNLCIYSTKDGSRFGTAIASTDLDGDGISEIFISAPYDDTGVIYVIIGSEIAKPLHEVGIHLLSVSSLKYVKRIVNANTKSFGVTLQIMMDVDKNGLNALAVGSMNSNKIVVYKSIPVINVKVVSKVVEELVREVDTHITVEVTVQVSLKSKQKIQYGKLFVKTNIEGSGASIANNTYEVIINNNSSTEYTNRVNVSFEREEPGDYKFTAIVEADEDNLNQSDYRSSLYTINPNSARRSALDVKRRCKDVDCKPKLWVDIYWSGKDIYELGSSAKENVSLNVYNDGSTTYQSCARVRITGAQFKTPDCVLENDALYKCDFDEIKTHSMYKVHIQLDMTKPTNQDENLNVTVWLYNNCAALGIASYQEYKVFNYSLSTTDVFVDMDQYDRIVTDNQINNKSTEVIDVPDVYTVTNNGTVTWRSIYVILKIKKEPFVKNYTVISSTGSCYEEIAQDFIANKCQLDLQPKSTVKFITTVNLLKKEMAESFISNIVNLTSTFTLYLVPTPTTLGKTLNTTIMYQADTGFGNNKNLVIIGSLLIGLFVLFVIFIILRKAGFFKRKQKEKLEELKDMLKEK